MQHLLNIEHTNYADIKAIIKSGLSFVETIKQKSAIKKVLISKTIVNLFFESSTRTKISFDLAGKKLGATICNLSISSSSMSKGETLLDTVTTINSLQPDILVVRHHQSGAAELIAQKVDCSIINAGDGCHEHPTQALADAVSILYRLGKIKGLKITICGDILHSRVARSNILLLTKLGAKLCLVGPPTLIPQNITNQEIELCYSLEKGIKDADVVMMLRVQSERMHHSFIPSYREYHKLYGLDEKKLSYAKPNALVMHPGPINRGVEISSTIADSSVSLINDQVLSGLAVRMAILEKISGEKQ